jgi:hypothetical protein
MTEHAELNNTFPTVTTLIVEDIPNVLAETGSACLSPIPADIALRLELACAGTDFKTLEDLKNRPMPESLIEGLIIEKTLAALYGPSGVGKSFVALDWAMAVAYDRHVWERETKPGLVIYVVAEGEGGFPARIEAWKAANVADSTAAITFLEIPIDLSDPKQVKAFIVCGKKLAAAVGVPISLIVIDTLARCMRGQENSTDDMKLAVEGADTIRRALEAAVLIVHHSKKDDDENMRGSGVLWASLQSVINLRKGSVEGEVFACVKKQKDGPEESFRLALDPIDCGEDENGKLISSLTVRLLEGGDNWQAPARRTKGPDHLTPTEQAMFDLVSASAVGLARKEWHEVGEDKGVGKARPATRNEAMKVLISKGRVFELDGRFFAA